MPWSIYCTVTTAPSLSVATMNVGTRACGDTSYGSGLSLQGLGCLRVTSQSISAVRRLQSPRSCAHPCDGGGEQGRHVKGEKRKDLLNTQVSTQDLAPADRETLEAMQELVGECAALTAAQGVTMERNAADPQAMLRRCADTLQHLAEEINRDGDNASPYMRMRAPDGSKSGASTMVAGRMSPRISMWQSVPVSAMSTGTKPSATDFST